MAATKLTLSVDKDTVLMAKEFAAKNNISVSRLFKNLVTEVTKKKKKEKTDLLFEKYKDVEIPKWIQDLTGVAKDDDPTMSYDDIKFAYFKERYDL